MKRYLSHLIFAMLIINALTIVGFNVKPSKSTWTGTVYIRADGSIDPPDAPIITYDNITYTLTDNITSSGDGIVVERDNIVVDGAGYTLQGTYRGCGFNCSNVKDVRIQNINVKNFRYGVYLFYSSNNSVSGNIIAENLYGIGLKSSWNNSITGNNITTNLYDCIYLSYSSNNDISGNNITANNGYPITLSYNSSNNNIIGNNIANNGGHIHLHSSSNNNIIGNNITANDFGINLYYSSDNCIYGNNIIANKGDGIFLSYSSNNSIFGNIITANTWDGICLHYSLNNNVNGNTITGNGITLARSSSNNIVGNWFVNGGLYVGESYANVVSDNFVNGKPLVYLENASDMVVQNAGQVVLVNSNRIQIRNLNLSHTSIGIELWKTNNTEIFQNNITNNSWQGIYLHGSSNNNISRNNIANNEYGIKLDGSSNNRFWHNNFINNTKQIIIVTSGYSNVWDDGYPSGGNYWSDYTGADLKSGPFQNQPESDGIGDIPYYIYEGNADRYPLMNPWGVGTPIANFVWFPLVPKVGETVTFDASTSKPIGGEIVSYEWDFGDGNRGYGKIVTHTYASAGTYAIALNVTDSEGLWDIEQKQIEVKESYNLTITVTTGGTTNPAPGTYSYAEGTLVSVTAIPYTNYRFVHWILDGAVASSANPIQILMDANHTLEAVFAQITYQLTISTTAGGTTNPAPGTYTYVNGTVVSVTAIPQENYVFGYWILDGINVGSQNPIDVLMTANHTLQAVFQQVFQLTITSTSGGTTNPSPGTYNYATGTELDVTAIPNTGYSFAYWLLDGQKRMENPITILMNANHTLEAYFADDIKPEIGEPSQNPPPENVQPNQDVIVTVTVTDYGSGVKNVTLWYSTNNGTKWNPINMTELAANTYQATIPGQEYCTWVTYKIVAYDNAGNNATKDNLGYYYKYHVIPEFPNPLPLIIILSIAVIKAMMRKKFKGKGRY